MSQAPSWTVLVMTLAAFGCGPARHLGFSNRVLHDVPSPDGKFRAICQEVPAFDGPEYETRLHRQDGTFVVNLAYGGDAQPCREIAWSTDGAWLAVVDHVSRVTLVDAAGAMRGNVGRRPNRDVSLTWPQGLARNMRFVTPAIIEFDACDAKDVLRMRDCATTFQRRRLDISTTPARGVSF